MDKLFLIAEIVSFAAAGALVALNAIAPLTKTDKDDKARDALSFVHDKVLSIILPFLAQRLAKAENVPAVPPEVK